MASDHQIFIRWNNPRGCLAAAGSDHWSACGVGRFINIKPEPCCLFAHPSPDLRGVLADACRENERIEPAKRAGK